MQGDKRKYRFSVGSGRLSSMAAFIHCTEWFSKSMQRHPTTEQMLSYWHGGIFMCLLEMLLAKRQYSANYGLVGSCAFNLCLVFAGRRMLLSDPIMKRKVTEVTSFRDRFYTCLFTSKNRWVLYYLKSESACFVFGI